MYFSKTTINRRIHTSNKANDITDLNINGRITKFKNKLKMNLSIEYLYDILQT